MGLIREMWQHMIEEKSKVDGYGDKGNPRSQWGIGMWQKVLSKLDFRSNNSERRQKGRKERKKREKKKSLVRDVGLRAEYPIWLEHKCSRIYNFYPLTHQGSHAFHKKPNEW